MKKDKKDFWERLKHLGDWMDSEIGNRFDVLCRVAFWPIFILWIIFALARIILFFL